MSTPHEPCEHRRQSGLMNVHHGIEPCPICEAEERETRRSKGALAAAIAAWALVIALVVWIAT